MMIDKDGGESKRASAERGSDDRLADSDSWQVAPAIVVTTSRRSDDEVGPGQMHDEHDERHSEEKIDKQYEDESLGMQHDGGEPCGEDSLTWEPPEVSEDSSGEKVPSWRYTPLGGSLRRKQQMGPRP